jgi:transglutaminase-like putative cysteine protease
MYYTIRHITRFRYSVPISESIMEVRIQPRSEGNQHCLDFRLHTSPRAHILTYRGEYGNRVHHFDIPNSHNQITISAEALVDITAPPPLPQTLNAQAWEELDAITAKDDYWDSLMPSQFATPTPLLDELSAELDVRRRDDPLTVMRDLNSAINSAFEYTPNSTRVDSPIDEALRMRKGVCQDYAHIMLTLARQLNIPCRYVSGYLYQHSRGAERSVGEATHAWVEAYLPGPGWVGFDPTNNTTTDERHIRVAIGRDYADVPPTRGVYRGKAESELAVTVRISPSQMTLTDELPVEPPHWVPAAYELDERDQEQTQLQTMPQQQQQLFSKSNFPVPEQQSPAHTLTLDIPYARVTHQQTRDSTTISPLFPPWF